MAWEGITFYWKHVLANLAATSTDTGYDVANILDRLDDTRWQAADTVTPMLIDITTGPGEGDSLISDYLGIGGHNFGSIGAIATLQWSSNGFDSTGSNLLTNGDFTSNTTGWDPILSVTLASVAGGQTGNCLEVTRDSPGPVGYAAQEVSGLNVGTYYKVTVYFKKGTGVSGAIRVGIPSDEDAYQAWTGLTDADWTAYTVSFKAIDTSVRINLVNESIIDSETALFDTASLHIVEVADAVTYTPTDNHTFIKEHSQLDKNYWRLEISGNLSDKPYITHCYWGEKTELGFAADLGDPDAFIDHDIVNLSEEGDLLGVYGTWKEREIIFRFVFKGDAFWQEIVDWRENIDLLRFFMSKEKGAYPTENWLVSRKKGKFRNPVSINGLWREITLRLTGKKEQ